MKISFSNCRHNISQKATVISVKPSQSNLIFKDTLRERKAPSFSGTINRNDVFLDFLLQYCHFYHSDGIHFHGGKR